MVGGLSVHVGELDGLADRRRVGHLENGRALVDLVEHRDVEAFRPGRDGRLDLVPVEMSAHARNARDRLDAADALLVAREVVPAEAGVDERHVVNARRVAPGDVLLDCVAIAVHLEMQKRGEALNHPRKDKIGLLDERMQIRIVDAIVLERPPARRHAKHHAAPAVLGIVVEEVDELRELDGVELVGTIRESDAPDDDERLLAVVEVQVLRAVARHLDLVDEILPVGDEFQAVVAPGLESREIVHHRHGPPVLLRRGERVPEDGHRLLAAFRCRARRVPEEALQEDAVESVLLHPAEMRLDRRGVVAAEEARRLAGGERKPRRLRLLVFGDVRPHVDADGILVLEHRPARAVMEPALIPRHHPTVIRRIDRIPRMPRRRRKGKNRRERNKTDRSVKFHS